MDSRLRIGCWLLVVGVVSVSCGIESSAPEPAPVSPREVRPEMVTGAAAAALGADGYFVIEAPIVPADQVSFDTARAQTLEFAKYVTNNTLLRGVVEAGRGGYWTEPHLLTLCSRRLSVVRPQIGSVEVDSLPDEGRDLLLRKSGPAWLIPMCGSEGEPQMTVQVAFQGNGVRFAGGVPITPTRDLLAAFSAQGVPLNWPDALPISIERAVRFVWDQLGVRIAEVPELYVRGDVDLDGIYLLQNGTARTCSRWRVVLEHEVDMRSGPTNAVRATREVWVSARTCFYTDYEPLLQVPAIQPESVTLLYSDFSVVPQRNYSLTFPLVAPIRFEVTQRAF